MAERVGAGRGIKWDAVVTVGSALAAIASAVFAGGAYFSSEASLRQQRETALLEQRAVSCAAILNQGRQVVEAIGRSALLVQRSDEAPSQSSDLQTEIDTARTRFNDAAKELEARFLLEILGPNELAQAEGAVGQRLLQARGAYSVRTDYLLYVRSAQNLNEALGSLQERCKRALGSYRNVR